VFNLFNGFLGALVFFSGGHSFPEFSKVHEPVILNGHWLSFSCHTVQVSSSYICLPLIVFINTQGVED
jgi:hypothetical protein